MLPKLDLTTVASALRQGPYSGNTDGLCMRATIVPILDGRIDVVFGKSPWRARKRQLGALGGYPALSKQHLPSAGEASAAPTLKYLNTKGTKNTKLPSARPPPSSVRRNFKAPAAQIQILRTETEREAKSLISSLRKKQATSRAPCRAGAASARTRRREPGGNNRSPGRCRSRAG